MARATLLILALLSGIIHPGMVTSHGVLSGLLIGKDGRLYAFSCYHVWGGAGLVEIAGFKARIVYAHAPSSNGVQVAEYSLALIGYVGKVPSSFIDRYRDAYTGEEVYVVTGANTTTCRVFRDSIGVVVNYGGRLVRFRDIIGLKCRGRVVSGAPIIGWDASYLGYIFAGIPRTRIYYGIKAGELLQSLRKELGSTFHLVYSPRMIKAFRGVEPAPPGAVAVRQLPIGLVLVASLLPVKSITVFPDTGPARHSRRTLYLCTAPGTHLLYIELADTSNKRMRLVVRASATECPARLVPDMYLHIYTPE